MPFENKLAGENYYYVLIHFKVMFIWSAKNEYTSC